MCLRQWTTERMVCNYYSHVMFVTAVADVACPVRLTLTPL